MKKNILVKYCVNFSCWGYWIIIP